LNPAAPRFLQLGPTGARVRVDQILYAALIQVRTRDTEVALCTTSYCLAILPASSPLKESTMNWDMIEGDWKQFKGHVKEKWGKLTDDNLDTIAGKRDQLTGSIQEAYGITKDQAELQVKAFEQIHRDYQPKISA
jgi:uncharacterized protein YjbJ (UPF0337 family)